MPHIPDHVGATMKMPGLSVGASLQCRLQASVSLWANTGMHPKHIQSSKSMQAKIKDETRCTAEEVCVQSVCGLCMSAANNSKPHSAMHNEGSPRQILTVFWMVRYSNNCKTPARGSIQSNCRLAPATTSSQHTTATCARRCNKSNNACGRHGIEHSSHEMSHPAAALGTAFAGADAFWTT